MVDLAIDASRAGAGQRSGTEWYSAALIDALVRLEDRPAITLYTRNGPLALPPATCVEQREVRAKRLWTHVGLSAAMVRDRPRQLFVPSHVIPLLHPRNSVITLHDVGFLVHPDQHPSRQRRILQLTTRWNARMARRIIAVSGQTRDDLVNLLGVASSKVRVVHSGVDHTRFHPGTPDARADLQALAEHGIRPPYLLFLSTVHPRKNVDRLLDAFRLLDNPHLQLIIAGRTGWLANGLETRIVAGVSSGRVVRLGYVADELVPILYRRAAAFVLPSLYEGFGMGVLEAMASGCPVVIADRSSLPEIAGGHAIAVDPFDVSAIASGIRDALDPQRAQQLRTAGLRHAATFTWERTARETLAVLRDAGGAHGPA